MKMGTRILASVVLVASGCALCLGSTASAGGLSNLKPVGAKQPKAGATLPPCDQASLAPPGGAEGACNLDSNAVAAANKNHAVALKALTLDVVDVKQITTIKIGSGSIHPLATDAWIAVRVQVKNTSGKTAQLRDDQFNLLLGTTRSGVQSEATSSEPDSLTKAKRKLANGKVRTGTIVFGVPVADAGLVTAAPSALLFAGFGGDWAFAQFPGNTFGVIRLSS
jgi:hypothetical protein